MLFRLIIFIFYLLVVSYLIRLCLILCRLIVVSYFYCLYIYIYFYHFKSYFQCYLILIVYRNFRTFIFISYVVVFYLSFWPWPRPKIARIGPFHARPSTSRWLASLASPPAGLLLLQPPKPSGNKPTSQAIGLFPLASLREAFLPLPSVHPRARQGV